MRLKKLAIGLIAASVAVWAGEISLQMYGTAIDSGNFKNRMRGGGARLNFRPFDSGLFFGVEGNYLGYLHYKGHTERVNNVLMNIGYEFWPTQKWTPFVMAGYGYQHVDYSAEPFQSGSIAQGVVGAKYKVLPFLDLIGDVKYVRDIKNEIDNWGVDLGLGIGFGTKWSGGAGGGDMTDSDHDGVPDDVDLCPNTPKGVKVDANGCPIDSDHDGVPDYLDKCPNTPKGVRVDKNGCPIDTDGDGVPDYLDKCPDTPYGVKVYKTGPKAGCPVDSDHDGVPDYLDKCPNTPAGTKVYKTGPKAGCPVVEIKLKKNKYGELTYRFEIHFPFNSAKILPKYMPTIEKFAEWLKAHPQVKVEIQGYTDSTGPASYNLILSTKRAKAVYEALIKLGVNPKQLSYKGYGEAHPIAPNTTPQGRALNRRVVAKILNPNQLQPTGN
jgi:OOP family OmpA-OmpF porin